MTGTERAETLGCLLQNYKQSREDIACLSSGVRDAAQTLAKIDALLKESDSDHTSSREASLLAELSSLSSRAVEAISETPRRLTELHDALRRKRDLKIRLDNLGYRDLIRS
ncbi:MAG: hypothetical protein OXG43_12145 [Chloroflexi bacterium]|nr:hypothetical protein [Chloroflexota bacterium]